MDKKSFEAFIGKQVEVFLVPDTPRTSGTLIRCEDDHIVIGEELWAYPAVLGIRPLKKSGRTPHPKPVIIQEQEIASESPLPATEEKSDPPEPEPDPEPPQAEAAPEVDLTALADHEFSGTLVAFYYERGYWGFIESEEVKKYNVPLRDGERIFVHLNQISDEGLRNRLMQERDPSPMIEVVFKLGENKHGAVADDVREKAKANMPKLPADVLKVDMFSAIYEEGEIEFFRRYEDVPYGEIRVKGNKLYRFYEDGVVDPALAVFLECSPSAEGQKVRFTLTNGKRGQKNATNISALEPFPDEKIKDWERSGLLQKAKERMGIKESSK